MPSRAKKKLAEKKCQRSQAGGEEARGRTGLRVPKLKGQTSEIQEKVAMEPAKLPLLFSANLPHSSIYKHQLPQKKWLPVKYQQKSLPHGASDNETSHSAMAQCGSPTLRPASLKLLVPDPPPHSPQPTDGRQAEG